MMKLRTSPSKTRTFRSMKKPSRLQMSSTSYSPLKKQREASVNLTNPQKSVVLQLLSETQCQDMFEEFDQHNRFSWNDSQENFIQKYAENKSYQEKITVPRKLETSNTFFNSNYSLKHKSTENSKTKLKKSSIFQLFKTEEPSTVKLISYNKFIIDERQQMSPERCHIFKGMPKKQSSISFFPKKMKPIPTIETRASYLKQHQFPKTRILWNKSHIQKI